MGRLYIVYVYYLIKNYCFVCLLGENLYCIYDYSGNLVIISLPFLIHTSQEAKVHASLKEQSFHSLFNLFIIIILVSFVSYGGSGNIL